MLEPEGLVRRSCLVGAKTLKPIFPPLGSYRSTFAVTRALNHSWFEPGKRSPCSNAD